MANKESAFTLSFDAYGDFVSVQFAGREPIYQPIGNIMKDPPIGRLVARRPLGELVRIDLGDGRYMMCYHLPTCDCVDWMDKYMGGKESGFSVSFDQYGDFVSVRFAGEEPIYQPTRNMMKDLPVGHLVATKALGELVRSDLGEGRYTKYIHLPSCEVIVWPEH